ncbi:MAG: hypothetical protein U9Q16_00455 [Patescibacteria group bacterium]|nr:hypothetical protein [Patescibacteria group bacterium]
MKKRTIAIIIFPGIIILILAIFMASFLFARIKKNSEEFIDIRAKIHLSEKQIGKFQEHKDNYEKLTPNLEKIDKLFVNTDVPLNLIKFFEEMAEDTELSIEISPFVPKQYETDVWNFVGFKMFLTGSLSGFSKFLEKTEAAPYLIEIQNLKIRNITKRDPDYVGIIEADLSIKVFAK